MNNNQDPNNEQILLILSETMRRILNDFRYQLISDFRLIISDKKHVNPNTWLKSSEVKKMLGISHGTLQTLRNNGSIPFTKVGGIIYYSRELIEKMLAHN